MDRVEVRLDERASRRVVNRYILLRGSYLLLGRTPGADNSHRCGEKVTKLRLVLIPEHAKINKSKQQCERTNTIMRWN